MEDDLINQTTTAQTEVVEEDWDNIPTASATEFFGGEPSATPAATTTEPATQTTTPATAEPAATSTTEETDDFWNDDATTPAASSAASSSLRSLLSEKLGIAIKEEDPDDAVLEAIKAKLQVSATQPENPIKGIESRLALSEKALVKARLVDEMKAGDSEFETEAEIDEQLEEWETNGALTKKAAAERRRLENKKVELETAEKAQIANTQAEIQKFKNEFRSSLEKFEFDGIKLPQKQIPEVIRFIESGEYAATQNGYKKDGTPMEMGEIVEQAIFANPTFRKKYIEKVKQEYGKKAVSDYIKGLENRKRPTETGGQTAVPQSSGEQTVGFREFFGSN